MKQGWKENAGVRDELLADLYESVLSPGMVPDVIARLNTYLDCDGVHLIGWDEARDEVLLSLLSGSNIQGAEAAYFAHYQAIDPRRKMGMRLPTGVCVACHDEFDDRFVSGSEFYQDFLIPHGPRYVAGGNVYREGGKNVHIAFNHLVGRPRFEGRKREALTGVMFHLARWMSLMVRADWLREAASSGQAGIDLLTKGVVFLDENGRVLHANPAAVRRLGDQLGRVNLGLSGAEGGESLDAHVRAVILTRTPKTLMIWRNESPISVTLSPLPRNTSLNSSPLGRLATSSDISLGLYQRASVVMTVRASDERAGSDIDSLSKKWGLTPAEAQLLQALMEGLSPTDHAENRGIKISTVRTQVRAVLEKSGYSSLRVLVATNKK